MKQFMFKTLRMRIRQISLVMFRLIGTSNDLYSIFWLEKIFLDVNFLILWRSTLGNRIECSLSYFVSKIIYKSIIIFISQDRGRKKGIREREKVKGITEKIKCILEFCAKTKREQNHCISSKMYGVVISTNCNDFG